LLRRGDELRILRVLWCDHLYDLRFFRFATRPNRYPFHRDAKMHESFGLWLHKLVYVGQVALQDSFVLTGCDAQNTALRDSLPHFAFEAIIQPQTRHNYPPELAAGPHLSWLVWERNSSRLLMWALTAPRQRLEPSSTCFWKVLHIHNCKSFNLPLRFTFVYDTHRNRRVPRFQPKTTAAVQPILLGSWHGQRP
jgi:hypothetical protein